MLANQYWKALKEQFTTTFLLLPQVSSGHCCPDNFEKFFVDIERAAQSCSLDDTLRVHTTLANIFDVDKGAILLAGIKEGKTSGSTLTFWLPTSLSTRAMNVSHNNASGMSGEEITCIRTQYNEIILADSSKVGERYQTIILS